MKTIKLSFDSIVQLRKFEGSISFLGFHYTINEQLMEIELETNQIKNKYKIEVTSGSVGVTFKSDEK